MCEHIDAEFVLANYFLRSSEPLTFGRLRRIRNAIESEVADVYVDVSTPSLASAVELHPRMFRWLGDSIASAEDLGAWFNERYVESNFNCRLNDSVRTKALQAILTA